MRGQSLEIHSLLAVAAVARGSLVGMHCISQVHGWVKTCLVSSLYFCYCTDALRRALSHALPGVVISPGPTLHGNIFGTSPNAWVLLAALHLFKESSVESKNTCKFSPETTNPVRGDVRNLHPTIELISFQITSLLPLGRARLDPLERCSGKHDSWFV